ncbi:MAG TPA: alpha/beta hydrolase [Candidatus Nanopelagicaceae bacterium]|nr:alpha/beta hydrolase [Candidatus Lokiarchaeota archaeon]HUW88973.1 alpha/beta hydrolase [Candidatus Nanopelagicaceae bacterium]
MVISDNTNLTIKLKDGRKLGYIDLGNKDGKPLFHFHGFPGSRLEATLLADRAIIKKIRVISIDRPGMGLSDFKKNRTLLDWPDDVVELADALGIDKFAIEGISGGGPYALACAYKIPERLKSCGIISGLASKDLEIEKKFKLFSIIGIFPWLLKLMMWFQSRSMNDLEKAEKKMKKSSKKFPEADRIIFDDPQILSLFIKESAEAFRQGSKGASYEGKIYARSWGFNLEDISPKLKVYIWHGDADVNVPVAMGRGMCKLIPNCEGKFYPGEGHYSTIFKYFEDIISTLIS